MQRFGKISEIIPENRTTWEDRLFLTFDCDWAHDKVIEDTLDLIQQFQVAATFFVTHKSHILKKIAAQEYIEVGIHPNFNRLLSGNLTQEKSIENVINQLMDFVPKASSARSHSLVCGSPIEAYYHKVNITHDSSLYVPHQFNSYEIHPSRTFFGGVKCPYFFCDFAACFHPPAAMPVLMSRPGLKIFDFHPIHVFLNSENQERYESTRSMHQKPDELIAHRFHGEGARTRLQKLLKLGSTNRHPAHKTDGIICG